MRTSTKLAAAAVAGVLGAAGLISWASSADKQSQDADDFGIYANYQSDVWGGSQEAPQVPSPSQSSIPAVSQPGLTPDQIRANVEAARAQSQLLGEQQAHAEELKRIRKETRKASRTPAPSDIPNCTPGYDPCLPPAYDYDCAGGPGNGPAYTGRVFVERGMDRYGLDANGDGVGCE
jgi:hypothetical protein